MDKATFALLVTVALALFGIAAKYWNDVTIARRKDRLDRVNDQLRFLYGPLFALSNATSVAAQAFYNSQRDHVVDRSSVNPLDDTGLTAWRLWMREVLMPLNLKIENVIVEYSDLLIEDEIPRCLLVLTAHIEAYKAVLKQWEGNDLSRHTSLVAHPGDELLLYASESFKVLKTRQAEALGSRAMTK